MVKETLQEVTPPGDPDYARVIRRPITDYQGFGVSGIQSVDVTRKA